MTDDELLFFAGRAEALPIYEALRERLLTEFPETQIQARKTQIGFKARYLYACASFLPAKRKSDRPDPYLTVTFGLGQPLYHERIAATVEARPNRWTHHVLVGSPDGIDDELMGWLRQARDFAEKRR